MHFVKWYAMARPSSWKTAPYRHLTIPRPKSSALITVPIFTPHASWRLWPRLSHLITASLDWVLFYRHYFPWILSISSISAISYHENHHVQYLISWRRRYLLFPHLIRIECEHKCGLRNDCIASASMVSDKVSASDQCFKRDGCENEGLHARYTYIPILSQHHVRLVNVPRM